MNQLAAWVTAIRAVIVCVGVLALVGEHKHPRPVCIPARIAAFAALLALVLAEKLYGLVFYLDLPATVAIVAAYLHVARGIGVRNSVYSGVIVFLCADFATALSNSISLRIADSGDIGASVAGLALYALATVGSCAWLCRFAPTPESAPIKPANLLFLLLALAPYIVLRSSPLAYGLTGQTGALVEVVLLLTIVATLGTFVGNYAAVRAEAERVRRLTLEAELQSRQKRYEVRRETMAEVNRRYHDMVAYARLFEQAGSPGSLDAFLTTRMTESLAAETLQETGSPVLDMLLWEAGEECRRRGVRLAPSVDVQGKLPIAPFDLHAIVGNALSNAIEAAAGVDEAQAEKREVRLRVAQVQDMLFVKVSNHFTGELRREGSRPDGALLTTKDDPTHEHGFGLANIRSAAQRYGGSVLVEVSGDEFTLTAMVPLNA